MWLRGFLTLDKEKKATDEGDSDLVLVFCSLGIQEALITYRYSCRHGYSMAIRVSWIAGRLVIL